MLPLVVGVKLHPAPIRDQCVSLGNDAYASRTHDKIYTTQGTQHQPLTTQATATPWVNTKADEPVRLRVVGKCHLHV